uniref:Cysteine-rich secretory protein 1 isoform a2 n=1 Tax=Cupiennius salei TaxID=6928 RepID=A0A4Y5UH22_CUPSA|nr:cysteine-rich secretory protein 1 isoform a2 [Cupiennius salei]
MSAPARIRNILLVLSSVLCTLTVIQSAYCPDIYKRYSTQHSYCLGQCCNCTFYKRGVDPGLKGQILSLHNDLRNKVAAGHSYGVDHLPRASNMLEMVWDDELATIAQTWLDGCRKNGDCEECRMVSRFAVGQEIIGDFIGSEMDSQDLDNEFFSRFNALSVFTDAHVREYSDSNGNHKTSQLLWAKTWRIGCGFLRFLDPNNGRAVVNILLCNYGPGGCVEGEEVYKAGTVCSACPANTCCGDGCKKHKITNSFKGLCKVIDENLPPQGNVPHVKSGKELFYCGFNGESDCSRAVEGINRWIGKISTGGTWLSMDLGRGGHTSLTFEKPIKSKSGKLCLSITTRTGPVDASSRYTYELGGSMEETGRFLTTMVFPKADNKVKHRFHTDYFQPSEFPKNRDVKLTLSFSVPIDGQRQYIEIKRIVAMEKDCSKQTILEGSGYSVD